MTSNDTKPAMLRADSAIRDVPAHIRLWVICVLGLAADLATKKWAWAKYHPTAGVTHDESIIPGFLSFTALGNTGALFGVGQGMAWFFILASIAAIGVVLMLFAQSTRKQWSLHIANGLILAGALGNLYDRWAFSYVRDFIHVDTRVTLFGKTFGLWPWVFNVADMMLVIGVGLLMLTWYFTPRRKPATPAAEQPSPPTDSAPLQTAAPATRPDSTPIA